MMVGSFKLIVGMPEDTVIAGIAKENIKIEKVSQYGGSEMSIWTVNTPSRSIALNFAAGRLSAVIEDIGPSDQSAGVAFAQAIWGALRTFESEGRTLCTIQAGNASEAGAKGSVSNMSASISCGAKTIDINILSVDTEDKKSKIATLNVTLGK